MYSIIIPAFNEEIWLPKTIYAAQQAMASLDIPGEIVVVDNNSTDATRAIAEQCGVKSVFEPINQISRARNSGARAAQGEYLIFVDADTLISVQLLRAALDEMESGRCCGGGTLVRMDSTQSFFGRHLFMFFVALGQRLQTTAGCFLFVRADAFNEIGGFSERIYATEEFWFSRQLKRWGKRHQMPFKLLTDQSVITSSRKFSNPYSVGLMLLTILVPFSIFFRSVCRFWYKRQE